MQPYIPYYNSDGNQVTGREERPFVDRNGNEAIIGVVFYKDKKGKMHEAIHYVKWRHLNSDR